MTYAKYLPIAMALILAFGLVAVKAETETFTATADIGNDAPIMSGFNSTNTSGMTYAVSAAYPVNEDSTIYFNSYITDANGDNVQMIVCNQSGLTGDNCTVADAFICNTTLGAVGTHQCSYTADSKPDGGDPATSWTAYAYAYDGTTDNGDNTTTTYTNHNPTVSGAITIDEATVYASSTMTTNVTGASKADVDAGDTTTYYYRFLDSDDTTVLQDWSTTSTYDCTSDGGGTGNGFCSKGDTIYIDLRAQDSHGAVSDGAEETYVETTKGITNTAPTIENLWIDGADAGASVNPTELGQTNVNVTVLVFDYDRTNDNTEITGGTGWVNCTDSYAADTTFATQNKNSTADYLKYTSLQMNYNTLGGAKTVTTYIYDKTDAASDSDNSESFTYNTIYVVEPNDTAMAFGSFTPSTNENLAGDEQQLSNGGNGILNLTIQGADLNYTTNVWGIGNFSVDDDNVADGDGGNLANLTLTTGAQQFNPVGGLAVSGTFDVWFFVDVPGGMPAGTYTSSSDWEWVSSQA
jgi:hypothetical protein